MILVLILVLKKIYFLIVKYKIKKSNQTKQFLTIKKTTSKKNKNNNTITKELFLINRKDHRNSKKNNYNTILMYTKIQILTYILAEILICQQQDNKL